MPVQPAATESIVLAGGCFWCVEGVYEQLKGVVDAESGYAGGTAETANYRDVSSHETDHAEVVKVIFDPALCPVERIYEVFFTLAHDPTQVGGQGGDMGEQYRSAIFYRDAAQKAEAEAQIKAWQPKFGKPIATRLEPLGAFYAAEAYHQNYANRLLAGEQVANANYGVCVALPKLQKLREKHPDWCK